MGQYITKKEYATITQRGKLFKDDKPNENCIRVYCRQFPNIFNFQIRTHKSINDFGRGVKRDMIANVTLSIDEVRNILKFMEAEKDRKD